MAADSSAGNAWVDSYLDARKCCGSCAECAPASCLACGQRRGHPARRRRRAASGTGIRVTCKTVLPPCIVAPAVLTYGLSSEYLKSTKEAQAKSKAPDADRSLYRCGGADPSVAGGPHR